jgi:Cu-Zn family superoxide dismutase
MRRVRFSLVPLALLALGGATAAFAGPAPGRGGGDDRDRDRHKDRVAHARLVDADGQKVGRVVLVERRHRDVVTVLARVRGLPPGFHGFHVHTTGRCEPPGFTTAGGHLNPSGATHGSHAGDLPSLLVTARGHGLLATATDRFTLEDLRDADGAAIMVHSGADNFANIPPRYGQPDQETRDTGDAGSRLACGVVR